MAQAVASANIQDEKDEAVPIEWETIFDSNNISTDIDKNIIFDKMGNNLRLTAPNVLSMQSNSTGYTYPSTYGIDWAIGKDILYSPDSDNNDNDDITCYQWQFKITRKTGYIYFGIVENLYDDISNDNDNNNDSGNNESEDEIVVNNSHANLNDKEYYLTTMQGQYYIYSSDGSKADKLLARNFQYGIAELQANNIVRMEFNVTKGALSFWVNNNFVGVLFENVFKGNNNAIVQGYRMAVGLNYSNDSVVCEKYAIGRNKNFPSQLPQLRKINILLKQSIKSINNQNSKLTGKYDENSKVTDDGSNENKTNSLKAGDLLNLSENVVYCSKELSEINEQVKVLNEAFKLLEIESNKRIKAINVNNYEEWSIDEIILWIISLENGRFKKYTNVLRKKFIKNELKGSDLPDITRQDWDISFQINNFRDRVDIVKYCQDLRNQNEMQTDQ